MMTFMSRHTAVMALVACFCGLACAPAWADQVILKDGTVIEGKIIPRGSDWWVKPVDGDSRIIKGDDVSKIIHGPVSTSGPSVVSTLSPAYDYAAARRKADACDSAQAIVAIWQKYIDSGPVAGPELDAAKAELDKWLKLAADNTERINGKWVGGEERKVILAKAETLVKEGDEDMAHERTLAAIDKYKEAQHLYPNSFPLNFRLGFLLLLSQKNDEAIADFEMCLKAKSDSPEVLNNLGVGMWGKKQYAKAIGSFYKAAQIQDSAIVAYNLVYSTNLAPRDVLGDVQVKAAAEAAGLLAVKYQLPPLRGDATLKIMILSPGHDGLPPGAISSGTGFFIDESGIILTNRHVVKGARSYVVMLNGGMRRSAEVLAISEDDDLALLRLNNKAPATLPLALAAMPSTILAIAAPAGGKWPILRLSGQSTPAEGAQCFVLGFPLLDRMGETIKITQGIVSGATERNSPVDILIDAKVNPGNSGGPLLDKYGQVIGIVTMKSVTSRNEDSYGMAIGIARMRKFLDKNHIELPPPQPAADPKDAEQIAISAKPATVCIIALH